MDSESMVACLCLSIDSFLANHERLKARYYITVLHLVRRVWSINWAPVTSLHFESFILLHKRSLTDFSIGMLSLLCPQSGGL